MTQWVNVQVPIGGGLDTKSDPRLAAPPSALVLQNAQFDEVGGIQNRYGFSTLASVGSNRRVVRYGDELLLFTKDALYTYSANDAAFVSRGTHYATKVTEKSVFVRSADQYMADRAVLSGVIVYVWVDNTGGTELAYIAATDKTTGATLLAPTSLGADSTRPRLVTTSAGSYVLLFAKTAANTLSVKAIDPTSASTLATTAAASWVSVATTLDGEYDCAALSSTTAAVVWTHTTATTYGYASVTNASTPVVTAGTKGREGGNCIALAVTAAQDKIAVVRNSTGDTLVTDILTSGFVDSSTSVATGGFDAAGGSTNRQITAAFRSTTDSGEYRCYIFWASSKGDETEDGIEYNWVNTAGTAGSESRLIRAMDLGSHAFDREGRIFVWVLFSKDSTASGMTNVVKSQVQNSYFLLRDDGVVVAKAANLYAGGALGQRGHLPSVKVDPDDSDVYSFCGVERRLIPVGETDSRAYEDRGPRDISIEFDTNEGRRCVQLGKTLFISGGQILQFDGEALSELSFHTAPWLTIATDGGAGSMEAGTYLYQDTYFWQNAKGETERSGSFASEEITQTATKEVELVSQPLFATLKHSAITGINRTHVTVEHWRTLKNPPSGAPLYKVSGLDPATTTGDNCYVANTVAVNTLSAFTDSYADSVAATKAILPQSVGQLEAVAPPAATVIWANDERLFLAGIAHDPLAVWPSLKRGDGELPHFNDGLVFRAPAQGGDVTAFGAINGTLIVFKERAIWAYPGTGFENDGSGQQFGPPQIISQDIGCTSQDLLAHTTGGIVFFSSKGWYRLNGFQLEYIGARVEDYNTDAWNSVVVLENKHQIRCVSSSRILTYDTLVNAWSEWTPSGVLSSCIWDANSSGPHVICETSAVKQEGTAYSSLTHSLVYQSPWFTEAQLGNMFVKQIGILGEYRSAHDLKLELFANYSSTAFQTKTWTVTPTTVGGAEIVKIAPSQRKLTAISIRITTKAVGTSDAPTGEGLKLTGLVFRVKSKRGMHRVAAAQQQ